MTATNRSIGSEGGREQADAQPSALARALAKARGISAEQAAAELAAPSAWEAPRAPSQAELRAEQRRLEELAEPAQAGARIEQPEHPRRGLDPSAHLGTREGWDRGVPHFAPLDWLRADFARAAHLQASAAACTRTLAQLPPRFSRAVRTAALACRVVDGRLRPTRGWDHIAARTITALAVTVWHASRGTSRDGMARVLVGRVRGQFCTLVRDPRTRAPYSIARLYATSHHGTDDPWDCGHMVALDRAGAFRRHQPPASQSPAAFVGRARDGSLRAVSQYWLTERVCERCPAVPLDVDALDIERGEPPS